MNNRKYLVIGLTILIIFGIGCVENTPPKSEETSVKNPDETNVDNKIKYDILNEEILDGPGKTQIILKLLVSGQISEQNLRELMNRLYIETKNRKGFKYHDNPTHIGIYLYTSKEYVPSQWIAMFLKIGEDDPQININDRQLSQLGKSTEEKFGLSEEQRKNIFKEIVKAEDLGMSGQEKYEYVAKKYNLTPEQVKEIQQEGVTKDWSLPPIIN